MKNTILITCICLLLLLSGRTSSSYETPEFDLLIKNGRVIDGTGNPWFIADLGINNGKIDKIGDLAAATGTRTIDAKGFIVSPGFIDLHNHSDMGFLTQPEAENYVRQGVTTLFVGHCGNSVVPSDKFPSFKDYFTHLETQGISANVAALVGHGQIRKQVIGGEDREPTQQELEKMKTIVAQAIEDGACGLSTGLVYFPGTYAKTAEIIELCKIVAKYDCLYTTHVRDDTAKWEQAVLEAIETAEKSGVRLHIVHNETHYPNWGKLDVIMRHIEEARERGLRVNCDVIPTLCGAQGIRTVFPNWSLEGGDAKLIEMLKNPKERAKIKNYVLEEKKSTQALPRL